MPLLEGKQRQRARGGEVLGEGDLATRERAAIYAREVHATTIAG
jgi:hypothetical protein